MDEQSTSQPRKRGAQPGNSNAFKHGFYSRWFREIELSDLENNAAPGVWDEINMLKVLMRRLFELVNCEEPDIETLTKTLTAIGRGAFHLGGLIRLQTAIEGEADEVAEALSAALKDVIGELSK